MALGKIEVLMAECKEGRGRVARSRGWRSSPYRRRRVGKPLDAPIRSYRRYEEGLQQQ
jgi:hypothetical protein